MMIGEGVPREAQSHLVEPTEKPLRCADACHGMQLLACKIGSAASSSRIVEAMKTPVQQAHRKNGTTKSRRRRHGDSVENHSIHLRQARYRFAQGPRGQRPAVHHSALIEHGDLDVADQAIVLQTIVGKDHIAFGMRGKQGAGRRHPVAADEHRATAAASQ